MKILMLHGYTQSGSMFHAKTKVLEKHLTKIFPGVSLSYPTGPLQLRAADIPGYEPNGAHSPVTIEAYAWWRRTDQKEPIEYARLEEGLAVIAKILESEGPFDGVIGFSQGAAAAAMVASMLEGDVRKQAFEKAQAQSDLAIPFPESFAKLDHPPLKFVVAYCGFRAPGVRYRGFYEDPHIQTPFLHVIGSLDSVLEESRALALVDATGGLEKTQVVKHPGGHFVPNSRQYLDLVAAFIKQKMLPQESKEIQEERVKDMDVPF